VEARQLDGRLRRAAIFLTVASTALALLLPGPAPALRVGPDDVEMVEVPAGAFVMGAADSEADPDEQPVARIFVETFQIDKVEVTNSRYLRCVEAGACSTPVGGNPTKRARAEHPVTILSWLQATTYCRWAGKRLPTEAEWEKAARGPDGRRYPWGETFVPDWANAGHTLGLGAVGLHPRGASPYGALDMAGSVWEWTSSLYRPYPYDARDGREDPEARGARVNRGGSWYYGPWYVRTTYRATADQGYRRVRDLGVRCAR
jgi:formylglycine-generating enzyme required for sulfatase activity